MNPLNQSERERIAAQNAKVKRLMPEMVPIIKDLHEAGLIDGWRSVLYVGPTRQRMSSGTIVRGDQLVLGSMADLKRKDAKK